MMLNHHPGVKNKATVLTLGTVCLSMLSGFGVLSFAEDSQLSEKSTQTTSITAPSLSNIPQFSQLTALIAQASWEQKPIMLLFTQTDCYYCEALKRDIILPMLAHEGEQRLLVREIHRDFHDSSALAEDHIVPQLMAALDIHFYPTIAIMDAEGHQLSKPLIGYQPDNDFYGHYFDQAINQAIDALK